MKLYNNNENFDLITSYFIKYLKYIVILTTKAKNVKLLLEITIIKKLDLISVSKRFSNNNYQLSINERIKITKL